VDDLNRLKTQMDADKKYFVKNISEVNDRLNWEQKGLREDQTSLAKRMDTLEAFNHNQ